MSLIVYFTDMNNILSLLLFMIIFFFAFNYSKKLKKYPEFEAWLFKENGKFNNLKIENY